MDPSMLPTVTKDGRPSREDDDRGRIPKQSHNEDSETYSSDNSEKQEKRRKLIRARRGKRPKETVNNGTKAVESSSGEDWNHHLPLDIGNETAKSSSDEESKHHAPPADTGNRSGESSRGGERRHHASQIHESIVDAEVVSVDGKAFSFTEEILPQCEAERVLGADRTQPVESAGAAALPPDMITTVPEPGVIPHTELEPLEEGTVLDFRLDCSGVDDGSGAPQHSREDLWVPASYLLDEPQIEERSVSSESSEGEDWVEPPTTPNPPGNSEDFQAHGEAVDCPIVLVLDSPTSRAIENCTPQSAERQALQSMEQFEHGTTGPSQQPLEDSIQQRLDNVEQVIAKIPRENSYRHAARESNNQPMERPDESARTRQTVEPVRQSSEVYVQQGSLQSPHYAAQVSQRSSEASISRASQATRNPSAMRRSEKVTLWLRQVSPVRPRCRFFCEFHEGFSALEDYGVGPNVYWRTTTLEGPPFRSDWRPTHLRRTRVWSIGQKTDGSVVGMHTGVGESNELSQQIYDRRIQRDEMRLVAETGQRQNTSQTRPRSLDVCEALDNRSLDVCEAPDNRSQNSGRKRWRLSETMRCCLNSFLIILRQCLHPFRPPEDRPIPLNRLNRANCPNCRSTAANTSTVVTAGNKASESSDHGTLGCSSSQVSDT